MFNPTSYQSETLDLCPDEITLLYQHDLTGTFVIRFGGEYHTLISDGHIFKLYNICSNCAGHIRMIKLDHSDNQCCQVCGSIYGRRVLN